jgi:hypothetical protein
LAIRAAACFGLVSENGVVIKGADDPLIVDGLVDRLGDPGDHNKFATNVLLGLKES